MRFLIMVPGIDSSRADASDDAAQEPSKNFLSIFNEQSSESRSTQNLNFNLTVIKSKVFKVRTVLPIQTITEPNSTTETVF